MIKIWFFGTPALSAHVLEEIINDSHFEVSFVVTNPDKAFWRKQEIIESPVKQLAKSYNLDIFQPEKIRNNEEFLQKIEDYQCDYFVVVAYGKILPKNLLDIPKKMCINVHGSILPKYRGASPIQSALLEGETETWVTIMQMSEWMDEGDMILIEKIIIDKEETSQTLFEKFGKISPKALTKAIIMLENNEITPQKQEENQATYCTKITKEDGQINWNDNAKNIFQKWQAYTPWPGIFSFYKWKRVLFEKISYKNEKYNEEIGKIIKIDGKNFAIICANGIILPEIIKIEGKKSQKFSEAMNGNFFEENKNFEFVK